MSEPRIVIIGAGQAGGGVAKALRAEGHAGNITLIGREAHAPYERPPLSKGVLDGSAGPDTTALFKPDALAGLNLDMRLDVEVTDIDRAARIVTLSDNSTLPYDTLVFATGGRARRLDVPGAALPEIHALRGLDDALALKAALGQAQTVAVVGGGWIGLEVAATARKLGLSVTVLEMAPRLAGRGAHPALSDWLMALHRGQGVDVRLGVAVTGYARRAEGGLTLSLSDGTALDADLAVEGIGLVPEDDLARAAGLDCPGGIATDPCGRTDDPAIFACGDVACFPIPGDGRRLRLESWKNAVDQPALVAKAILGKPAEYTATPWFWSDQFGHNIQILGLIDQAAEPPVCRAGAHGAFTWLFPAGERLMGAVAVDQPMDIKIAQRLIERGIAVSRETLEDPSIPLKSLLNPR